MTLTKYVKALYFVKLGLILILKCPNCTSMRASLLRECFFLFESKVSSIPLTRESVKVVTNQF